MMSGVCECVTVLGAGTTYMYDGQCLGLCYSARGRHHMQACMMSGVCVCVTVLGAGTTYMYDELCL